MTAWDDIRFEWARGPFRLSTEDSLVVMARIAELEAAGRELAHHLNLLNGEQWENRYTATGPCSGCYQAVIDWNELVAVSAVGGAPGVSETHTDPKEAPHELR